MKACLIISLILCTNQVLGNEIIDLPDKTVVVTADNWCPYTCVKGETEDGNVRFVLDGNRKLKEINIKDDAFNGDKDELIDDLITAFNNAIDDADHVNENEMRNTAFNMFPGMGG